MTPGGVESPIGRAQACERITPSRRRYIPESHTKSAERGALFTIRITLIDRGFKIEEQPSTLSLHALRETDFILVHSSAVQSSEVQQ